MTQTLEERIREILRLYELDLECDILEFPPTPNAIPMSADQALTEILKAVEEVIPEECKDYEKVESYIDGWNDCLAELRKNIHG